MWLLFFYPEFLNLLRFLSLNLRVFYFPTSYRPKFCLSYLFVSVPVSYFKPLGWLVVRSLLLSDFEFLVCYLGLSRLSRV